MEGLRRGSKIYNIDGFLFYKANSRPKSASIYCQMRNKTGCQASGKLDVINNTISLKINTHNHEKESHNTKLVALKSKLKENSKCSSENLRTIFDETCRQFPDEVSCQISFPQIQRSMHYAKSEKYPTIPQSIENFTMDLQENEYFNINFKSIIFDHEKIIGLLFFNDNMINSIGDNFREICYDGTFFVVPKFFTQLFIISVKCGNRFLPTFFILMSSKKESIIV